MQKKTKKKTARNILLFFSIEYLEKLSKRQVRQKIAGEILLFFSILIFILIVWGFISLWNLTYNYSRETISASAWYNRLVSPKLTLEEKISWRDNFEQQRSYNQCSSAEGFRPIRMPVKEYEDRLAVETLYDRYKIPKHKKFTSILDFEEEIAKRHPVAKIMNYLYIKDKKNILTITSKITFFLFYPVRLIVILILWSIRTIKE